MGQQTVESIGWVYAATTSCTSTKPDRPDSPRRQNHTPSNHTQVTSLNLKQ